MSRTTTGSRGVRAALLAILALSALLLSIVAMHASMVQTHDSVPDRHAAAAAMPMGAPAGQMDAGLSSDHSMGDMNLADCLLFGMICFLTAAAVLIFGLLVSRLRGLLRTRQAAQSLGQTLRRFRAAAAPSLLVLSISRT